MLHLLFLGLIGALSGVLAIVANQRIEPFFSFIVANVPSVNIQYTPKVKTLYSARQAVEEEREIRIRDGYREELQVIHEILIDEYDFREQYYPVSLSFTRNSFEVDYAGRRKQGRRETSREDLLALIDDRISKIIGRIAAYAGIICILAFAVLILLALI